MTEENDCAAEPNSAANPSHAVAAASIGPEPAPEYINAELISGDNTKKLIPRVSFHIDANTTRLTGDGHLTPQFRRSDASQGRYATLYETRGPNVSEFTEPTRQGNVHAT